MARHKNRDWDLQDVPGTNRIASWDMVKIAVLMDIRDELQTLNNTLGCYRVQRMSDDINRIQRRLAKHMPLQPRRGKRK